MALVKGKFVDKDILIQSNNDPVDDKDLARKGYVDAKAASEAASAASGKQDSLGTGTTSQFLRGDLTWQEVQTSVGIAQTKIVSKGGDDSSGDGSFSNPFATIAAAMASITDASPTKRYIIKVESGAYTETDLSLKANVFIVGDVKEAVRITANSYALDSSFSGSSDNRSGMARVILNGACNFDWATVTSAAGKLYMTEVSFSNDVSLNGHNNAIAQAQFDSCIFFGNLTVSGINVGVFKNNTCYGNIALNQHPNGGMATIFQISGGNCWGSVTLTTSVNDFNRRCAIFAYNFYMGAITVDGPSSYADMTDSSVPSAGPTILNGGNVVYVNKQAANNSLSNLAYPTAVNQPILPASSNATNLGDWGKQWFYNFAYVHASSGTDLYLTSVMETYDAAGDTSGKSIWIQADGYGLQENVNGGDVIVETSAVSGTGVRGKVKINARELDMTAAKITDLADGVNAQDAVTKSQLDTALALKIDATQKGAANGLAELDAGGKVPVAQLPGISITDTYVVVDEAAMLALAAEKGDIAIRSDLNKSFVLSDADPSVLANWLELLTPTDAVLSVNGQVGSVSLDSDDIAEGATNKYFSDALAKAAAVADSITDGVTDVAPSQDAVHAALAGKADLSHTHVAADVTDFDSAAKAAAVVNSTAGSETDQAASVDAMKSYVAGEIAAITMPSGKKERFVLSAADISNGYVDCAFAALADTMILMTGGVIHNEGSGEDYVLSEVGGVTRIAFEPDLAAMLVEGDDIYVQYLK